MKEIRDHEFEIHKHHRDVQIKHSNYLLAVCAAAIAFSVQKTTGLGFKCTQFPLAIAVLLWALSFIAGCIFTRNYLDAFHKNAQFLGLLSDEEDYEYSAEEEKEQSSVESEMNRLAKSAYLWGEVQFYSMVIGGGAFITWHLVEMAAKT